MKRRAIPVTTTTAAGGAEQAPCSNLFHTDSSASRAHRSEGPITATGLFVFSLWNSCSQLAFQLTADTEESQDTINCVRDSKSVTQLL